MQPIPKPPVRAHNHLTNLVAFRHSKYGIIPA